MADEQKRIMIVEDDRFLSSILKGRLEKEGFIVMQAFDGESALTQLRENKPNLIILDIIMPKMSGFEFLEALASDPQVAHIPVVVASNLGQESDIQKAKDLGVVDYYVKVQVSVDDLIKMIKNQLASGKSV
ncbi:MAG: response regulator [bacterium]|nr:response regulator [bacterium]